MSEIKCPLCGFAEQVPDGEDCCPRCGTRLTDGEGEKKLLEASGTFTTEDKQFFGKMSTSASIYLTDRRLLAIPEKLEGFNLRTGLTAAAVNKMTGQYGAISIPLEEIQAVRDGKFGLLQKALVVIAADGGVLKLTLPKQTQWKEAILAVAPNLH